jgi:hypothetical protein
VIEANTRNSHHSHGPTTTKGKQAVRHNAVTHGLLARALVFKSEHEERTFGAYRRRLCAELVPKDALEMMFVEDLANAEWRLKRATRWEQAIGRKNDTTAIAENALRSGTETLGISSEHAAESGRGWRCKELKFSLTTEKGSEPENAYIRGDPDVELSAHLTDPVGDLDTIIRYQRAIRKDRDNAMDRLFKLQRSRAKVDKEAAAHRGSKH